MKIAERKGIIRNGWEWRDRIDNGDAEAECKTYIQVSGAALAVATKSMIAVWILFMIAILAGAFYQFLATKLLESYLDWGHDPTWDWLQPGYVYGVMLPAFYGGTIVFTLYIVQLRHQ